MIHTPLTELTVLPRHLSRYNCYLSLSSLVFFATKSETLVRLWLNSSMHVVCARHLECIVKLTVSLLCIGYAGTLSVVSKVDLFFLSS